MPSYVPPLRATEFIFYIGLVSQADNNVLITNPTLAAGDFLVSTDGNAFTNLDTTPSVDPAGGTAVKVTISIAEMTGDNIFVVWEDVAGAQWASGFAIIQTVAQQIDDIPTAVVISDAVWDEVSTGHVDAGKAGQQLWTDVDAILTDTNVIGALGGWLNCCALELSLGYRSSIGMCRCIDCI